MQSKESILDDSPILFRAQHLVYVGEQNDERRAVWMSPMCFFLCYFVLANKMRLTPYVFLWKSRK